MLNLSADRQALVKYLIYKHLDSSLRLPAAGWLRMTRNHTFEKASFV
jgi:hypothetical protein